MNLEPWRTVSSGAPTGLISGVQYLLRHHGHAVAADGVLGPATAQAVTSFQSSRGLAADGVVGPDTWRSLVVIVKPGSTGDAVRALQSLGLVIIPEEPPLTVDGLFGPATEGRVTMFQDLYGLAVDGVAGMQTWAFATASNPWPLVAVGHSMHTNHRVLTVQHLLRARGATVQADGLYGPASGAALRAFQETLRSEDLGTTCGQLDWPGLVATVRPGDSGETVRALQHLLPDEVARDGSFGPATERAVREFQQMFGLGVDGIVGPATWEALVKPKFD
ncbi:MAG: peptidoglycan-binding domain-containing protein [Actinomycetes bacterium]